MAPIVEGQDRYLAEFERLAPSISSDAGWLVNLRRQAIDRFAEIGFPTTRDEEWKFTSVTPIVETPFRLAVNGERRLDPAVIARFTWDDVAGVQLVCLNGRFAPHLSTLGALPKGSQADGLARALANNSGTLEPYLAQLAASFIFGLPTDTPETFEVTADLAQRAGVTFAQFVTLTPFPGTVDFARWEREAGATQQVAGIPLSRYWLIPPRLRPKIYTPHPAMSAEEIRLGTQLTWDRFYSLKMIWERSKCVRSLKGRLAFLMISKLYRQMYANTGIATDSARHARSTRWARWLASPCRRLFMTSPMPELNVPTN